MNSMTIFDAAATGAAEGHDCLLQEHCCVHPRASAANMISAAQTDEMLEAEHAACNAERRDPPPATRSFP